MGDSYDFDNPDDALAFTIAFALAQHGLPARRPGETLDTLDARHARIAREIVQQMKLSNWRFEQGLPKPLHSTLGTPERGQTSG
jgi:hypothetical protein